MGYYIRVLAKRDEHVPIVQLREGLYKDNLKAKIEYDEGAET